MHSRTKKSRNSYTCCSCERNYKEDGFVRYLTFADSFGDTIGQKEWRICIWCSDDLETYNRNVFIMGIFLLIVGIRMFV